jgi:hypothetical protein
MRYARCFGVALLALLLASPAVAQERKSPAKAAATGGLAEDKGKWRIMVEGRQLGTEEFQISLRSGEWQAQGKFTAQAEGAPASTVQSRLRLNSGGNLVYYEWSVEGEKKSSGTLQMDGKTVTIELRLPNAAPFTQQFFFETPRVVILDNNMYHHYLILAALYDWQQRGVQTFSVVVPQDLIPGSVTLESLGTQETQTGKLDVLRLRSSDLEVDLYFAARRLIRLVVPASNVVVERE